MIYEWNADTLTLAAATPDEPTDDNTFAPDVTWSATVRDTAPYRRYTPYRRYDDAQNDVGSTDAPRVGDTVRIVGRTKVYRVQVVRGDYAIVDVSYEEGVA